MPKLQNRMRLPVEDGSNGVFEVVDEALDGTKAIPIVFVSKSAADAGFAYGSSINEGTTLKNEMAQPIESDNAGNSRVVDEDVDGKKAIPFVAVTKGADGKFVYADIGGGAPFDTISVNSFSGSNGGAKIQNALNVNRTAHKVVVVPPGEYEISETLKIPSNTTLYLYGATLKLADGVNDRIITNSDYVNGNSHVYIYGVGDAIFDCNRVGQGAAASDYTDNGVHFYKVSHFAVANVTIKSTKKMGFVPEACSYGKVDNITFAQEGYVNQDGCHIVGPSHSITVDGLFGTFGDDACVCNARTNPPQGYGNGGDVTNIIFNNVQIKGLTGPDDGFFHTGILRTSAGADFKVDGITLSNAVGETVIAAARLGGNDATTTANHRNITMSNVKVIASTGDTSTTGAGIIMYRDVANLTVNNLSLSSDGVFTVIDTNGFTLDGFTLNGLDVLIKAGPAVNNYIFKFRAPAAKNVSISNMRVQGPSGGTSRVSAFWFTSAAITNFVASNLVFKDITTILTTAGTATMSNVRLRDWAADNVPTKWVLSTTVGLTRNGAGSETTAVAATAVPTTANWDIGDMVEFTNTGDTSKSGTYMLMPSGSWAKLA